ncbi:hypothetical protein [Bacillus sp. FSL K6-3431]|uniref:hypothetical protein n=1 Tax=Bacillus sp. FSL K6-3431 TaxID=2921500 RepID=UPI0030F51713
MKKMLGVLMISVGLLSACQGQEPNTVVQAELKEQGLVQVKMAVESDEINTVLKQFHEEGKEIIEVIPLDKKNKQVMSIEYTILFMLKIIKWIESFFDKHRDSLVDLPTR